MSNDWPMLYRTSKSVGIWKPSNLLVRILFRTLIPTYDHWITEILPLNPHTEILVLKLPSSLCYTIGYTSNSANPHKHHGHRSKAIWRTRVEACDSTWKPTTLVSTCFTVDRWPTSTDCRIWYCILAERTTEVASTRWTASSFRANCSSTSTTTFSTRTTRTPSRSRTVWRWSRCSYSWLTAARPSETRRATRSWVSCSRRWIKSSTKVRGWCQVFFFLFRERFWRDSGEILLRFFFWYSFRDRTTKLLLQKRTSFGHLIRLIVCQSSYSWFRTLF